MVGSIAMLILIVAMLVGPMVYPVPISLWWSGTTLGAFSRVDDFPRGDFRQLHR
jgi:hypothetical protein